VCVPARELPNAFGKLTRGGESSVAELAVAVDAPRIRVDAPGKPQGDRRESVAKRHGDAWKVAQPQLVGQDAGHVAMIVVGGVVVGDDEQVGGEAPLDDELDRRDDVLDAHQMRATVGQQAALQRAEQPMLTRPRRRPGGLVSPRRAPRPTSTNTLEASVSHQPRYADLDTLGHELRMDAWHTVRCAALLVDRLDPSQQLRILLCPPGGPSLPPRVVAARGDLQHGLYLVCTIDRRVAKRDQGLSIGQYLTLAAINRCVAATSKSRFAEWYAGTILPRLCPAPQKLLAGQRFWDAMDHVSGEAIRAVEAELSRRVVEDFELALRTLCFDCTNFDSYIDSTNSAQLPQRGHAKSKRTDLRIVGLALMVSVDGMVPLFSQIYAGNQADSVTFRSVTDELVARYRLLAREAEHVTLLEIEVREDEGRLAIFFRKKPRVLERLVREEGRARVSATATDIVGSRQAVKV